MNTAEVKNGTMSITTNGMIELRNKPFEDFVRAEEEPASGIIMLPRPILWRAQTDLVLSANFETAPVATTSLSVELMGMKLVS